MNKINSKVALNLPDILNRLVADINRYTVCHERLNDSQIDILAMALDVPYDSLKRFVRKHEKVAREKEKVQR